MLRADHELAIEQEQPFVDGGEDVLRFAMRDGHRLFLAAEIAHDVKQQRCEQQTPVSEGEALEPHQASRADATQSSHRGPAAARAMNGQSENHRHEGEVERERRSRRCESAWI